MTHVCCVCGHKIALDSPGEGVSHGLCRLDALRTYKKQGDITVIESLELTYRERVAKYARAE